MNGQGIETMAVRRAVIADTDKVRYRVYRAPDDFIAVIAESALMAVKVSGITDPYRIVRDLPSEGISMEAERMSTVPSTERVSFSIEQKASKRDSITFPDAAEGAAFVPMKLRDFQTKTTRKLRVLTADQLQQMEAPPPPPPPAPPVEMAAPEADPVPAPMQEEPVDVAPGEPEVLSPEDVAKLLNN